MIEKLRRKIFWIIQISLTAIMIGIILIYSILNYNNTIRSAMIVMDKFVGNDIKINNRPFGYEVDIDGVYNFSLNYNHEIIRQTENSDDHIKEYAVKVSKKDRRIGIIGKYIYEVKRIKNGEIEVTLIENENIVFHLNVLIYSSIVICILCIIIIYFISKKVSLTIVKPVEETLEKQKQFISDASHELKTPLAVIEANTDVIENEVGRNKWIEYIQNEIGSMNKLVNELLLLAKVEDKMENSYIDMDLSEEVEIITSMFESMAYEKGIILNMDIKENIKFIGDREDIKHILSTLIDNAIKHTEKNKNIVVELFKEKSEIVLKVKNEGLPIPTDEQDKIFERFYRIDKARNRSEKRYGLGLAIAKQTVEKYGGTIGVCCRDNVTSFIVKLKG